MRQESEISLKNRRSILRILGVLYLVAFIGFFIYQHYEYGPVAKRIKDDLEREFRLIEPPPDSTPNSYCAYSRPESVLVGGSYSTERSFSEIKQYYDTVLKNKSWNFQREIKLKEWGEDLGGKEIAYCKESYSATIEYAGPEAKKGWTYSFSMSWGLHGCGVAHENHTKKLLIRYGLILTCIAFIILGLSVLLLPKDKMVKYVFRKKSEEDFKDQVVFQINLILYKLFGIIGIVVGSFLLKKIFF